MADGQKPGPYPCLNLCEAHERPTNPNPNTHLHAHVLKAGQIADGGHHLAGADAAAARKRVRLHLLPATYDLSLAHLDKGSLLRSNRCGITVFGRRKNRCHLQAGHLT